MAYLNKMSINVKDKKGTESNNSKKTVHVNIKFHSSAHAFQTVSTEELIVRHSLKIQDEKLYHYPAEVSVVGTGTIHYQRRPCKYIHVNFIHTKLI